ncbi:MAG: glycoside hydrolase family 32 protein [Clostridia bacterium]|nr:glycoside hydrolase family 32 protein [Clostridia bacterium]
MKEMINAARKYRETLLNDPHRPGYHFAIPEDNGIPGDPNGAFYADGVYHLMYLHKNSETNGFHWGHLTSTDLLHWRRHKDALTVQDGDEGCFSGGAFVDDDKTAYLTFWKFPAKTPGGDKGGIAMACARPPYEDWERMEPIAVESGAVWGAGDLELNGETVHLGCADPSNIWKMNGRYYMQLGNKVVLDTYGRDADSPQIYKGDWTELYRSDDLRHWEFVQRFYVNDFTDPTWPDVTEDDMCPSFLPLFDAKADGKPTGKWLQLFISHNKGCQYYVGELQGETFVPEMHGRMSWNDNTFFAPEAIVDDRNRHIMWVWLLDNLKNDFERFGWSGVYSFPRLLWWENNELHMAPADELEQLQYNHQELTGTTGALPVKNGTSFRLKASWENPADGTGCRVRRSNDGSQYTDIFVDMAAGKLVMDAAHSGSEGRTIREEAPFVLRPEEKLELDIFVDGPVVEVYANQRQAICRRVYPDAPAEATGVCLLGNAAPEQLDAWEIAPANPY